MGPPRRLSRINAWTDMGMKPIYPAPTPWDGPLVAAAPSAPPEEIPIAAKEAPVGSLEGLSLHEIMSEKNAPIRERLDAIDHRLSIGAFVDARDEKNRSPLHIASGRRNQRAIVERLIQGGADVNAWTMRNKHPSISRRSPTTFPR